MKTLGKQRAIVSHKIALIFILVILGLSYFFMAMGILSKSSSSLAETNNDTTEIFIYEVTGRDDEGNATYDEGAPVEVWAVSEEGTSHMITNLLPGKVYVIKEK